MRKPRNIQAGITMTTKLVLLVITAVKTVQYLVANDYLDPKTGMAIFATLAISLYLLRPTPGREALYEKANKMLTQHAQARLHAANKDPSNPILIAQAQEAVEQLATIENATGILQ